MNELNIFSWIFSRISTWLFLYILVLLNMLFSFPKAMSDNSGSSVGMFLSCYFRPSSSFSICLVIFWLTTWHCRSTMKHWMILPFSRKDLLCLWQAVRWEADHFKSFRDWTDSQLCLYEGYSRLLVYSRLLLLSGIALQRSQLKDGHFSPHPPWQVLNSNILPPKPYKVAKSSIQWFGLSTTLLGRSLDNIN